ncbi:EpsG family protein [Sphingobacterium sp.]|uniref:EpsG family protein n=1 Tax=Sphingobacterium sp. TaxID=341027 RepID=UPI0028975D61|nr:EpsG family protein [Sphingobacterium sp.]
MVYLIPLIIILLSIFSYDVKKSKGGSNLVYIFIVLVLICISAFRYKVGGDSQEYFSSFINQIPKLNDISIGTFAQTRYEPFWVLLNSLCKTIVEDFAFFQFVHATFINIIIAWFFTKYTPYRFTAIFIYSLFYFLYYNMEILRESLAISFFLLAYPFLVKRVWLKYYILAFVGTMFHSSGIIMFFLPLFRNTVLNRGSFIRIAIIVFLVMILLRFAPNLIPNPELRRRFESYQEFTPSIFGFSYYLLIYFLGPLFIYLQYKKERPVLFPELITIYFTIAAVVSYLTGFTRFINYFMPFLTIYFTNYLFLIAALRRYRQVRSFMVSAIFILVFMPKLMFYFKDTSELVAGTHTYNLWFPYASTFDKEENETRRLLFYRSFNYSREYKEKNKEKN